MVLAALLGLCGGGEEHNMFFNMPYILFEALKNKCIVSGL